MTSSESPILVFPPPDFLHLFVPEINFMDEFLNTGGLKKKNPDKCYLSAAERAAVRFPTVKLSGRSPVVWKQTVLVC